jgi:hypothetical protein
MRSSAIVSSIAAFLSAVSIVRAAPVAEDDCYKKDYDYKPLSDFNEHPVTKDHPTPVKGYSSTPSAMTKDGVVHVLPTPIMSKSSSPSYAPSVMPPAPASTGAPPPADYPVINAFAQSVLDKTNYYRSLHSAANVTWDDTLASFASTNAASCSFHHTANGNSQI